MLATVYRDRGKVRLSIPAAREALRVDPQQTEARIILCSGYSLDGSPDEARQVAQEIIAADPMFRLSAYAHRKLYKYRKTLEQIVDVLGDAGLPD